MNAETANSWNGNSGTPPLELLVEEAAVELVMVVPLPAAFTTTVPPIHEWYTQWYE